LQIVSTMAPATVDAKTGQHVVYAVYDTFVDGKSLVVGLTIGLARGNALENVQASPTGLRVIETMASYHHFRYPHGAVILAGVASASGATQRVRKVLANAPDQSAVLLLCADSKIYDKAFAALHVNLQAGNMQPQ
jgi:hypothetical protein